jgi:hypothetical protein
VIHEALTDEEAYLAAILMDESGLDLAEFTWVAEENEDACFRAWPFQWTWWRCTDPLQIDQGARSIGKALLTSTPIRTPSGWTTMGELAVGDQVFGSNGQPTTVTKAYDARHGRPCYEVDFDDGSTVVADAEHQWFTEAVVGGPGVRTTQEIARTLTASGRRNHRIPVSRIEVGKPVEGPISPYLLGYWLGDGTSAGASLTVGAQDIDEVRDLLLEERVEVVGRPHSSMNFGVKFPDTWEYVEPTGDCSAKCVMPPATALLMRELHHSGTRPADLSERFGVSASVTSRVLTGQSMRSAGGWIRSPRVKSDSIHACLERLGVLGNKHIPWEYMNADVESRTALLQGLMDSDGRCGSQGGRCEITQKSERLARQIHELLASLGQKPRFEKRQASCNGVEAGPVYRVHWLPHELQPFRLSRKVDRVRVPRRQVQVTHRIVTAVRPVASVPVRCIEVDAPDHLFLAGEALIPTHNSESIAVRANIFPFIHPGQEMVVTAPEKVHLEAITDKIETRILGCRLSREMLSGGGGRNSFKHQPFHANFRNGSRIMGRIPQRDGKGMKGVHPIWLELDEGQDFPKAGWTETIETLKRGHEGAVWRAHGVTRGVRDEFYKFTQPDSGWRVHHITAMARPTWTDEERQEKIQQYNGTKEDPDYRRNVMGMHGDNTNPLFVLHKLMACVDEDQASDYNLDEYHQFRLSAEMVRGEGGDILSLMPLPESHLQRRIHPVFWCGMDVGYTTDPSEILVFAEMPRQGKSSLLKLLTRIHLSRIDNPLQVRVVTAVLEHYRPKVFAMDKTGLGLPLFHDLQAEDPDLARLVRGYNFSEKILVGLDESVDVDEYTGDVVKEAGIRRNVKEYAQDCLRVLVDEGRLLLPWDRNLIGQFQGGTATAVAGRDQYGRRRVFSGGEDHALDAARMAAIGHAVYAIEEMLNRKNEEPVLDMFFVV